MGELADSDLISRRLADMAPVIVAAPSYLAAHCTPENVGDLRDHTAILSQKTHDHWDINGETVRVAWRICTGNVTITRDAVRAGLGIARLPEFFVAQDLTDGTLARRTVSGRADGSAWQRAHASRLARTGSELDFAKLGGCIGGVRDGGDNLSGFAALGGSVIGAPTYLATT
jgi:DNA-binding transcriptional LysR family regulator